MSLRPADTSPDDGVAAALARARPLLREGELLLVSDFDGTLSPLVLDPWGARIVPSARRALRRLAVASGVHVALLSGRTVTDLAERTRVGGAIYLGDHGAERAEAPRPFRATALRVHRESPQPAEVAMIARLAAELPAAVPEPWLVVERKCVGITFHFRAAPDVPAARDRVRAAADDIDPRKLLGRRLGARVLELRARGATDKGEAMRRLIGEEQPAAVIMLGDDRNDALAFGALRAAREEGSINGLAVAVAGHPDHADQVAPHADLVLEDAHATARFLGALARTVLAKPADLPHAAGSPPPSQET
jgi:trehalose-phosphatase